MKQKIALEKNWLSRSSEICGKKSSQKRVAINKIIP